MYQTQRRGLSAPTPSGLWTGFHWPTLALLAGSSQTILLVEVAVILMVQQFCIISLLQDQEREVLSKVIQVNPYSPQIDSRTSSSNTYIMYLN